MQEVFFKKLVETIHINPQSLTEQLLSDTTTTTFFSREKSIHQIIKYIQERKDFLEKQLFTLNQI